MSTLIRYVAYVLVIAALAVSVWIRRQNLVLQEANTQLRVDQDALVATARSPVMISGFHLPLLRYTTETERREFQIDSSETRVILFYRDSCDICKTQLQGWTAFLSNPALSGRIEAWLVATEDSPIATATLKDSLELQRISYRVFSINSALSLSTALGIRGVPTTLVTNGLSDDAPVRFVSIGLAEPDRLQFILDELLRETDFPEALVVTSDLAEPL